ncbi:hypothetical protein PMIN06_009460 [Paraphaeosphaeria minitans]
MKIIVSIVRSTSFSKASPSVELKQALKKMQEEGIPDQYEIDEEFVQTQDYCLNIMSSKVVTLSADIEDFLTKHGFQSKGLTPQGPLFAMSTYDVLTRTMEKFMPNEFALVK